MVVGHKGETSNQLFSVLEEWETVLKEQSKDILSDDLRPKF